MSFHKLRREIRTNEQIEDKARKLIKQHPNDYETLSHVYRAGVNLLFEKRGK